MLVQVLVSPDIQLAFNLPNPVFPLLRTKESLTYGSRQPGEEGERAGAFDVADLAGRRGRRSGRWETGVWKKDLADGAK